MVDLIEKRIYELVKPWNGRSWLTFKMMPLNKDTPINQSQGMNMDPLDAEELLTSIFTEFGLDLGALHFSTYYPENRKDEKPLTINMLIESARAGRWLYD